MDMTEVTIDTFTRSKPEARMSWLEMTLTHNASGKSVKGTGSSKIELKTRLIAELEVKIGAR